MTGNSQPSSSQSGVQDFLADVAGFVDSRCLLVAGAKVVVAVSGGVDSVALLASLTMLAGQEGRGYSLLVAHMDHMLRPDAQADAQFVAELAAKWGLPCVVERRDVHAYAAEYGLGTEQAARELRYAFLHETAARNGAGFVAVGHHADDDVETVLYRILRGTSLHGLAGMPVKRPLAAAGEASGGAIDLIRPLLNLRRSQIEQFCQTLGLQWRTDSTNADIRYRRNFIRNELLPLVREKLSTRPDEALLRLAASAAEVDGYMLRQAQAVLERLSKEVASGLGIDAQALANEDPAIQAYVLRLALERLDVPLRDVGLEQLHELRLLLGPVASGACALPGGFIARREADTLAIRKQTPAAAASPMIEMTLDVPGRLRFNDGRVIEAQFEALDREALRRHVAGAKAASPQDGFVSHTEYMDADELRGPLVVRARRAGDRFVPLGAGGTQSVSDFLTNLKLPEHLRAQVLCVCDDLGIVYLAPLRIDQRVRVTDRTRRVVKLDLVRGATTHHE